MTVTLFASIVNFLVDYIFIDILSAPTADSLKVSSQESMITKTLRRVSNVNFASGNTATKSPIPSRPTFIPLAKSRSFKDLLISPTETRIVPPGLMVAHVNATESFHDVMRTNEEELEKWCSTRQSLRLQRLSQMRSREEKVSPEVIRPVSLTSSSTSPHDALSHALGVGVDVDGDVDNLFETMKEELLEERSLIRRPIEKESFDALWG